MGHVPFEKLRAIDLISHRLKSLVIIFFLSIANFCLVAQSSDCAFYVASDQPRKKIRHSIYPLNFTITENINASLKINDKGSSNTIELVLDFEDKSGLPTELGTTLSIKFSDHTTYSIIASSRKIKPSIVYFTISETGSRTSTTNHSNKADRFLTDKLSTVDIRTFEITADYKQREIPVAETKSEIIKKTILCLLNSY